MPSPIIPILLAGGAGTRLWPVSRDALPKQFLPLVGEHSTYQQTLLRVQDPMFAAPIVITGPNFHFFARRQAEEVGVEATVVIEPLRRDSAAAIAAATAVARQRDPMPWCWRSPPTTSSSTCRSSAPLVSPAAKPPRPDRIVTFGIKPTEPKTSYGYILPGEAIGKSGVYVRQELRREAGRRDRRPLCPRRLSVEFRQLPVPRRRAAVRTGDGSSRRSPKRSRPRSPRPPPTSAFCACSRKLSRARRMKSIDYAVMEKTDRAAVVAGDFRWSDIGSWDALFDITPPDAAGNVVQGPAVTLDASGCVVHSDGRLVAAVGVKDLVVVSTSDAVMVVPRARAQEVKQLVDKLKAAKRPEATDHKRVHRPWGYYESIDMGERFQVKRIVVIPGGVLSLQKHRHRAEHWVVVRGTAEVTIADTIQNVHENESVYIPIGSVHRMANQGKIPLELIEVQTGSYLGEDDIERIEDIYKRS